MIAVSLPEIRGDFGLANSSVGWLVSSYLIAMAVVQPAAGRIGDELGRLRVFRLALIAFLAFSLLAVFSPNFGVLLLFRTLQAVAGAILIPNGIGMLRAAVPAHRFGTYSGLHSAVIGSTAALGPLLGAAIIVLAPWRALFLANIPFVLAALFLSSYVPALQTGQQSRATRIDILGFILFAALLATTTWMFNSTRAASGGKAVWIGSVAVAVALVFIIQQRKTTRPVANWALFRIRSFVGASTHILLMNLVMYTSLLAIPFFITDVQGKSAITAGVLLGAMAALQAASAPLAGRVSDAIGRRRPALFSSSVALAATLLLLVGVNEDTAFWYLATAVTVLGLGVGVGFVTAATAANEAVEVALSGSAAGTQSMMRYLGSIIGTGILTGLLATGDSTMEAGIGTFRILFAVVAIMAAVSLLAATMIRPFPTPSIFAHSE